MNYIIKSITQLKDIEQCNKFEMKHFLWKQGYTPKSYGFAGILNKTSLIIKMVCEEKNPIATYTQPNSPVYLDSTVEAFLQFMPRQNNHYFNFEINSNGAMLAQFGSNQQERTFFTKEQIKQCTIETKKEKEFWWVQLMIPISLLQQIQPEFSLEKNMPIRCNFYKICQSREFEHYASYSPIDNPIPNFHLPEFFAQAIIQYD